MNSLLAVINKSGISMNLAPVNALTLGIKKADMSDDGDYEILDEPLQQEEITYVDLVVESYSEIVSMRTLGKASEFSQILGFEKGLKQLQKIIKKKSKEIIKNLIL